MKVRVLSAGKYQSRAAELTETLQAHYTDLFAQSEVLQKNKLLQFWQTVRNPRKSTPFTWDHFFKVLLTQGIIDVTNKKDVVGLGRLIEDNSKVRDALLSLPLFGGQLPEMSQDLIVEDSTANEVPNWRTTVSDQLRDVFKNNPQFLEEVLTCCPSFVEKLHDRTNIVKSLITEFPATITPLFAHYDQHEQSWQMLVKLINGPAADIKLKTFLLPDDAHTTSSDVAQKTLSFYANNPRVWHIAIGEQGQNFDRMINLGDNPCKMLERLAVVDQGPDVIAAHVNEITQFLYDRFGPHSKELYKFLHKRRKYHDGYGSFAIDLVRNLKQQTDNYINGGIEYRELTRFAEMVLEIPSVLENVNMSGDQLAALLRFKNKKREGKHSNKLEWLLCSNDTLFAKMREAGNGEFRAYLMKKTAADCYPRAHARYDLRTRFNQHDDANKSLRAWFYSQTDSLDAQRVYEFVNQDKYWKQLFKVTWRSALAFYRIMLSLSRTLGIIKLVNYFEAKLKNRTQDVSKKHPLFELYFEWKSVKTTDSFVDHLFKNVKWLRNHKTRANTKQIKDTFRFMFNKATPSQLLELCHATGDDALPKDAIDVINSDPDFIAKYFIALRATEQRPEFVEKVFSSVSLRTHGMNLLSKNNELIQYTLAALARNSSGQAQIVDIFLTAGFTDEQQKALLEKIPNAPTVIANGMVHKTFQACGATGCWNLYQLNSKIFSALTVDQQNNFAQVVFSDQEIASQALLVEELRVLCNDDNIFALFTTGPWSNDALSNIGHVFKLHSGLLWQSLAVATIDFDDDYVHPSANNNFERLWNGDAGYNIKDRMWVELQEDEDDAQSFDLSPLVAVLERTSPYLNAAMTHLFFDQTINAARPFLVDRMVALLEQGGQSPAIVQFAANLIGEQRDVLREDELEQLIKACPPIEAAIDQATVVVSSTPSPQLTPQSTPGVSPAANPPLTTPPSSQSGVTNTQASSGLQSHARQTGLFTGGTGFGSAQGTGGPNPAQDSRPPTQGGMDAGYFATLAATLAKRREKTNPGTPDTPGSKDWSP